MKELPSYWYGDERELKFYLLVPLSFLFCAIVWIRRTLFRIGIFRSWESPVPVIVVGNITVGGSGKTPLVIWLANMLKSRGFKPGLVSRGYGGSAKNWPQQVRADSDYVVVGDEAVMLAARTECPMAVGPDRPEAIRSLVGHHDVDVVISDDGMQHYAMGRDIEIAVINGVRRLGNGFCLPAGPLRETEKRLESVDMVVVNGEGLRHEHPMQVSTRFAVNLVTGETRELSAFKAYQLHAIAGIGHPERFFESLENLGIELVSHAFPDHYVYRVEDIEFENADAVLMTEKDAVKCMRFANKKLWCVPATVNLSRAFEQRLLLLLEKRKRSS